MTQRILLCGAPSSGKTTIINALITKGYFCKKEISRELIKESQKIGIAQPFLKDPEAFDSQLLEKRIQQFQLEKEELYYDYIFFDRGIVDNVAYMNYGIQHIPKSFEQAIQKYRYDQVFLCKPWEAIHVVDKERYESFEIANKIHDAFISILNTFKYNYKEVPFGSIEERVSYIIQEIA